MHAPMPPISDPLLLFVAVVLDVHERIERASDWLQSLDRSNGWFSRTRIPANQPRLTSSSNLLSYACSVLGMIPCRGAAVKTIDCRRRAGEQGLLSGASTRVESAAGQSTGNF